MAPGADHASPHRASDAHRRVHSSSLACRARGQGPEGVRAGAQKTRGQGQHIRPGRGGGLGKRANPPQRKPKPKGADRYGNHHAGTRAAPAGWADKAALLSAHFPLVRSLVNAEWARDGMALLLMARLTPLGLTCVVFLVDLCGVGLRDAAVHARLSPRGMDRLTQDLFAGHAAQECSVALAQDLVYGGVDWARRHGFSTPPEALGALPFLPPPASPPDLGRFGLDGRPLLIGDAEEIARFVAP